VDWVRENERGPTLHVSTVGIYGFHVFIYINLDYLHAQYKVPVFAICKMEVLLFPFCKIGTEILNTI
jgi:hypothetical protein